VQGTLVSIFATLAAACNITKHNVAKHKISKARSIDRDNTCIIKTHQLGNHHAIADFWIKGNWSGNDTTT